MPELKEYDDIHVALQSIYKSIEELQATARVLEGRLPDVSRRDDGRGLKRSIRKPKR